MPVSQKGPSNREQDLITDILQFKYDPEGFVRYAFPWGVKNTPLEKCKGPRRWQVEEFTRIKEKMASNRVRVSMGLPSEVIYLAISSGRGPGKSAFLAMLSCWFNSCWMGGTNIVTANTEPQLRSRTMAELGKWHATMINRHWFEKTAMAMRPNKWFAELLGEQLAMDTQYYYTEAQTWSDENPDAFAGAHSQIGMMVQFDEASGISDAIWNVTEGFFTDMGELRIWVAISNPRRNTGRFFECFHKFKKYWLNRYIDSREVEGVDAAVYQRIADKHGEDHDITRVEVRGLFPQTGATQFIGRELVMDAQVRELAEDEGAPLIMGVDVARFGADDSVITWRKGRDARSIPPKSYKGLDTMELADKVAIEIGRTNPDAVMIDGGGVGGGVVDRLKQMGYKVIEVQSGEKANEPDKYFNKRCEMWGIMRDWLSTGCVSYNDELLDDLTGPEYDIVREGVIKLEGKKQMISRGLKSPDYGDSLGLTFAQPVARLDLGVRRNVRRSNQVAETEYDIYG